jgi:hypothetical protein
VADTPTAHSTGVLQHKPTRPGVSGVISNNPDGARWGIFHPTLLGGESEPGPFRCAGCVVSRAGYSQKSPFALSFVSVAFSLLPYFDSAIVRS